MSDKIQTTSLNREEVFNVNAFKTTFKTIYYIQI